MKFEIECCHHYSEWETSQYHPQQAWMNFGRVENYFDYKLTVLT